MPKIFPGVVTPPAEPTPEEVVEKARKKTAEDKAASQVRNRAQVEIDYALAIAWARQEISVEALTSAMPEYISRSAYGAVWANVASGLAWGIRTGRLKETHCVCCCKENK